MPKPGARKPLFQAPIARGQPGWLQAIARDITAVRAEVARPRAGEKGWLVSMAEGMEEEGAVGTLELPVRRVTSSSLQE